MAVPPPHTDEKASLRRTLRAARQRFVAGLDAQAYDAALAAIDALLSPLLARRGPIAGYVAHRGEADPLPFLTRARHAGHEIVLPHVPALGAAGAMLFMRWPPSAVLTPGHAGIPQPAAGQPTEPAIVLAPLLGFDRTGARLGQGGGFYDRWFAAHPAAMRIGIAWSVQEVPALVAAPWDIPLHAIVTEKEWITPA